MDHQYRELNYQSHSLEHRYGENVFIASNPYWISLLNRFSTEKFEQPLLNLVLSQLYSYLCAEAVGTCLALREQNLKTRMAQFTDKAVIAGK